MPSLAPSTAARSQLDRWLRWISRRATDVRTPNRRYSRRRSERTAAPSRLKACGPTRSPTVRWRPEVVGRQARGGDEPGDHRVRVPHLARPELVASPHGRRHGRDEVAEPACDPRIAGQPARRTDSRAEIRDGPIAPAADLVAEEAQPAEAQDERTRQQALHRRRGGLGGGLRRRLRRAARRGDAARPQRRDLLREDRQGADRGERQARRGRATRRWPRSTPTARSSSPVRSSWSTAPARGSRRRPSTGTCG